jgi:hypothetical protein
VKRRLGPKIAAIVAVCTLVVGGGGLIVSLLLGALVFDDFDAYGEVPVPGSGSLHLPAGEVTINFHTAVTGSSGGGFPVPPLRISMAGHDGLPDPVLTEVMGSVTSVNNDVRVRVWTAQIAEEGVYDIRTGGEVNGYINPALAFGRDSSPGWMPWVFGALLAAGIVELAAAVLWMIRAGQAPQPARAPISLDEPPWPGPIPPPVNTYQPTDHGVRMEQLKTLAALRDSGALTEAEFQAEKRRVLDS